jgi:thioredoxin 1
MMAPTFEELAREYQGKMIFAKLNTDNNQRTAARLGIQGIPTMIFFSTGREVNRIVGAVRREVLKKQIDAALAAAA